jgi:hypothetical protein
VTKFREDLANIDVGFVSLGHKILAYKIQYYKVNTVKKLVDFRRIILLCFYVFIVTVLMWHVVWRL